MKQFIGFIGNERTANVLMVIKVIVMLLFLYLYLMYADLSTAPEFIYNQF